MKCLILCCALLGACSSWCPQSDSNTIVEMSAPATLPIPYFAQLSEKVVGGGELSANVVLTLPELGYTTIINLQHPEEDGVAAEVAAAIEVGIDYISLPMGGLDFTREQALAVADAVNNAKGFVVLHCRSGARVTAIWALSEALDKNLSAEQATDIARNHGCHEIHELMIQRVVKLLNEN